MARRISWTNNSTSYDGTNIYRDTTIDPQNLPAPVATVGPTTQGAIVEWIDTTGFGDQCYAVRDFEGQSVGDLSASACVEEPDPFDPDAEIGDYTGGGVYAGIHTIGSTDYHIISAVEAGSIDALQWKTTQTSTSGTTGTDDGQSNTSAMESAGLSDHPAAEHCIGYDGGGHDDWFMPAIDELALINTNLGSHAEFVNTVNDGARIWSSTESAAETAIARRFSTSSNSNDAKDTTFRRTWPIRRVLA